MATSERLAIYRPSRTVLRDLWDSERRDLLCVGCGGLLGVESTARFPDATHTSYGLLPGYRENALGVYIRKRPPRRARRTLVAESPAIEAARFYERAEFGEMVGGPVVVYEHHLVWVTRKPPFVIECSWKLCKERNLVMGR